MKLGSMPLILFIALILVSGCAQNETSIYQEARDLYSLHRYREAAEKFDEFKKKHPESVRMDAVNFYMEFSRKKADAAEKVLDKTGRIKEPVKTALPELKPEEEPEKQPLISNVFFETDIREALSNISAQTNIPIIADDTVSGLISLELEDTPLEKAMQMLLVAGGYTFRKMDGYYLVGAADPDNPTFILLSNTEYVKPSYVRAGEIVKLLPAPFAGFVQVCEERNQLSITASPEMIKRIKEDIVKIDRRPRQVMIQAVILDLSDNARKELGTDWSWSWDTVYDRNAGSESKGTAGMGFNPFSGLSGQGLGSGLGFDYQGVGQLTTNLLCAIRFLVEKEEISILATPRIATMDGKKASINIGTEEYISITSGPATYPYTEVETIKYGIVLNITPYISDSDEIIVDISPAEVGDLIGKTNGELPVISRRQVSTTIRVHDGETIIIGGLIRKKEVLKEKKFFLLGEIPLFDWLFKSKEKRTENFEIIVLITPRILNEADGITFKG